MKVKNDHRRTFSNLSNWKEQYQGGHGLESRWSSDIREFKQSTTAGATTAAVTEKVWGEYVSVGC